MLTGAEIVRRQIEGDIVIEPWDEKKVNPNSYNLTLNDKLFVYDCPVLDSRKNNPAREIIIPEEGYTLVPGVLYIGSTNEYTEAKDLIPQLDGRSSTGRLGIQVHVTAGFGDVGFKGKWTLEITVIHPVIVYPNMEICQISYFKPDGPTYIQYNGKYQNQDGAIPSKMYEDLSK